MSISMSFDRCIQLCNHCHKQDKEHFHYSLNFPQAPLQSIFASHSDYPAWPPTTLLAHSLTYHVYSCLRSLIIGTLPTCWDVFPEKWVLAISLRFQFPCHLLREAFPDCLKWNCFPHDHLQISYLASFLQSPLII